MLGTAFVGAYTHIRGISIFLGHYPNEFDILKQLKEGSNPTFEGYFYLYMVAIVIVFALGTGFQWKCIAHHKHVKDHQAKKNDEHYRKTH